MVVTMEEFPVGFGVLSGRELQIKRAATVIAAL